MKGKRTNRKKKNDTTPSAVQSNGLDLSLVRISNDESPSSRLSAKFGMRRESFYKVMFNDVLTKGPRIPLKFIDKLTSSELPEHAKLQALSTGKTWRVKLEKREDGVFFADFWEAFCKKNEVKFMDLLIFTHIKDFFFTVDIFDKSGNRARPDPSDLTYV